MKTDKTSLPMQEIRKIATITIGSVVIVAGFAALMRLGKIMIIDLKEMGL